MGLINRGAASPKKTAGSDGRTLILHIGDHKTGSTSIQYALARGDVLVDGRAPHYGVKVNHNHLPKHFRAILSSPQDDKGQEADKILSALAEKIAQERPALWIMSAEEFEGIDPHGLKRLVTQYFGDHFDHIKVVAYVRPHLQRFISSYAERTKIGTFSGDMETFFKRVRRRGDFTYAPRFRKWRAAFGDDFVLRPFLRSALREGDLLTDFIYTALGPVQTSVSDTGVQNQSLSLEDLLRVKFLHAALAKESKRFHHSFGWAFSELLGQLPAAQNRTKVQIHKDLAERAAAHFAADAQAMDAEFFAAAPCLQTSLETTVAGACEVAQPSTAEALFSDDEMRSLALSAQMVEMLLANGKAPWPSYFQKRRAERLHQGRR